MHREYLAEIYFHEEPFNLEEVKITLDHCIIPLTFLVINHFIAFLVWIIREKQLLN